MSRTKVKIKVRNWVAIHAHFRKGAGSMKDKKKEGSRKACRKKVKNEQHS